MADHNEQMDHERRIVPYWIIETMTKGHLSHALIPSETFFDVALAKSFPLIGSLWLEAKV
jgi:hypothetical protein